MKNIPLATPTMHGEEQRYIQEAFDTNWVSPLGPNVDAFEQEIADYVGASASAVLSSGTAALHLSAILAGVKEDDIVFIPSLTFAASVNPVRPEKVVRIAYRKMMKGRRLVIPGVYNKLLVAFSKVMPISATNRITIFMMK